MSSYWGRFFKRDRKPAHRTDTRHSDALTAYVLPMRWKGQNTSVLSLMPESAEYEIAPAVVGSLIRPIEDGGTLSPENFVPNPEFVAFMHEVIERRGCEVAALRAAARQQGEGWVYILDGRTPDPQGEVPPEDIIGAFEVQSGDIVLESYRPSPKHQIFSTRGLFQLQSSLHQLLFEELQQFISMFSKVSAKPPGFPTISLSMVVACIRPPGQPLQYMMTVAEIDMFKHGLPSEVIFGSLKEVSNIETGAENSDAGIAPENFLANPLFKTFLHEAIAQHAPELPEYQSQAQELQNGWLYLIDGRAQISHEFARPQDIIGAFFVRNGTMRSNWYRRNHQHRLYTSDGFFELPEALISRIKDDMIALSEKRASTSSS